MGKFNIDIAKFNKSQTDETEQQALKPQESLADLADKFKSTSEIFDEADSAIDMLNIDSLLPFSKHPFILRNAEYIAELAESIRTHGVITPIIVRVHPEERGKYEILAGHHRHKASLEAGLKSVPCIIKNVDDDTATLIVIDSNKQRGIADMLPSEIARALKLEYEALKHQGKRSSLIADFDGIMKGTSSAEKIGDDWQLSGIKVRRYIKLNDLIEPLLDEVDEQTIKPSTAYELSFLTSEEQYAVAEMIDTVFEGKYKKLDYKKAVAFKLESQKKKLTAEKIEAILQGELKPKKEKSKAKEVKLKLEDIKNYLPDELETDEIADYILDALKYYTELQSQPHFEEEYGADEAVDIDDII